MRRCRARLAALGARRALSSARTCDVSCTGLRSPLHSRQAACDLVARQREGGAAALGAWGSGWVVWTLISATVGDHHGLYGRGCRSPEILRRVTGPPAEARGPGRPLGPRNRGCSALARQGSKDYGTKSRFWNPPRSAHREGASGGQRRGQRSAAGVGAAVLKRALDDFVWPFYLRNGPYVPAACRCSASQWCVACVTRLRTAFAA